MADIPKTIKLTGQTASADFGTVGTDKAWLIKSVAIESTAGSSGTWGLAIGGDTISLAPSFTGSNQSRDALSAGASTTGANANLIAEDGEVVRLIEVTGDLTVNARLSYIEIDV